MSDEVRGRPNLEQNTAVKNGQKGNHYCSDLDIFTHDYDSPGALVTPLAAKGSSSSPHDLKEPDFLSSHHGRIGPYLKVQTFPPGSQKAEKFTSHSLSPA